MTYLKIRWNVKLYPDGKKGSEKRVCETWQNKRWEMFKNFTMRSLEGQKDQDWQVWLQCDKQLRYLTRDMEKHLKGSRIKVVYDLKSVCKKVVDKKPKSVIFGRLDSDDMLHEGAVARWAEEKTPGLLQFGFGYVLDFNDGRMREWNHKSASVIARIGDWKMFAKGVPDLGGVHTWVYKIARRINDFRWYAIGVHGLNLSNNIDTKYACLGPWVEKSLVKPILRGFHVTLKEYSNE
jgi:hypothetical protein